jgi:uncharacterized protein
MTTAIKPNRFGETFGYPDPNGRAVLKLRDSMTPYVQDFIRQSPFMIMASSDADGHCDASPKGGQPGFVKVLDERHVLIPDVAGNKLFQSYQNLRPTRTWDCCFLFRVSTIRYASMAG